MAKRSYGTGRLYVVVDRGGRASWYGSWWVGGTRIERELGLKRAPGNADGLTRTQAERELRRRVDAALVVAQGQRRTIPAAGAAYISHLENVMERKHATIADYRGYLRRHLSPFFGDRPMDRIDAARVETYLHADAGTTEIHAHAPDPTGGAVFAQKAFGADRPVAVIGDAVSGEPQSAPALQPGAIISRSAASSTRVRRPPDSDGPSPRRDVEWSEHHHDPPASGGENRGVEEDVAWQGYGGIRSAEATLSARRLPGGGGSLCLPLESCLQRGRTRINRSGSHPPWRSASDWVHLAGDQHRLVEHEGRAGGPGLGVTIRLRSSVPATAGWWF